MGSAFHSCKIVAHKIFVKFFGYKTALLLTALWLHLALQQLCQKSAGVSYDRQSHNCTLLAAEVSQTLNLVGQIGNQDKTPKKREKQKTAIDACDVFPTFSETSFYRERQR